MPTNVIIKITKSENDEDETKFASYNLKGMRIPVGEECTVPYELYDKVLSKGNLKDRVVLVRVTE